MEFLVTTFDKALKLLLQPNPEIWATCLFSLLVAAVAIILALAVGTPCGAWIALKILPGRTRAKTMLGSMMGFPPVLIGLFISLLCRPGEGLLGNINLLHTPVALVITQTLIVLPVIIGFTIAGIERLNHKLVLKFLSLGASQGQLVRLVLWEIRFVLAGAILVSAGRILSEVGAALMSGGNIPGYTQTMATGITMETMQGQPEVALALGIVLFLIIVILSVVLTLINHRGKGYEYDH